MRAKASRMSRSQACVRSLPPVAVVADDAPLREAICFALIAEGYPVLPFESGEALLAADGLGEVGCFVIDHRPAIDAVAVIEQLEGADLTGRPVVIATRPAPALRDACWRLGAPIVEKPILGESLNACIRGLLATKPSVA